jgi:hypothetical protein
MPDADWRGQTKPVCVDAAPVKPAAPLYRTYAPDLTP